MGMLKVNAPTGVHRRLKSSRFPRQSRLWSTDFQMIWSPVSSRPEGFLDSVTIVQYDTPNIHILTPTRTLSRLQRPLIALFGRSQQPVTFEHFLILFNEEEEGETGRLFDFAGGHFFVLFFVLFCYYIYIYKWLCACIYFSAVWLLISMAPSRKEDKLSPSASDLLFLDRLYILFYNPRCYIKSDEIYAMFIHCLYAM